MKCVCREARMKVVETFQVAAPPAEREVSRANDDVRIVLVRQKNDLGVKTTCIDRNRFDVLHPTCVLRPKLLQRSANTLNVD